MLARSVAAVFLLAGCPGGTQVDPKPPPHGSGHVGTAPDAAPSVATNSPDERECHALVAHAVGLEVARIKATKPPDKQPTDAEIAALTTELQADPGCRTLSRPAYDCAMAARSLADLEACYSTRKSSTSNSSVAPPGMTPAAPRSP